MRRSRIGFVFAVLFTLANVAGGIYAGMMGEVRHAGLHIVLAMVGMYVAWILAIRRRAAIAGLGADAVAGDPGALSSRLNNLEQSLDAIAVEVERVGESQRFMTRLFTERRERKPGDE